MSESYGGVLIAFLAIFVSFTGGVFWTIISFAIHQVNTTEPFQRRDALHYRRQITLRNEGPASAAWNFVKLWRAHRKTTSWPALRLLPCALLASLTLLLFYVSGIFTSHITSVPGNSTIVLGPHCGGYDFTHTSDASVKYSTISKLIADTNQASTYVRQCYQDNPSLLECGTFVRPSLPFTTTQNVSCPFASEVCVYNDQSAFFMDTGLLDSHQDLGINAPRADRIHFRRAATCSPVAGRPFEWITDSSVGPVSYIFAGETPLWDQNFTFSYIQNLASDNIGYILSAADDSYYMTSTGSVQQWIPDPRLSLIDANTVLFMLTSNSMEYLHPSDDPWMSAHKPITGPNTDTVSYSADFLFTLLGCVEQYQICNPNIVEGAGCTSLASSNSVLAETKTLTELGFNPAQHRSINRFFSYSSARRMPSVVQGRGASALNINEEIDNLVQNSSPPNQWQIEVSNWFSTCLAQEQYWAVEWATQPRNFPAITLDQDPGWIYLTPNDTAGQSQCKNQLMRLGSPTGYQSFSVLGVALILIIGVLIIVIGLVVDKAVAWLHNRREGSKYKKTQWEIEETLALHKAAYAGLGLWRDNEPDMPASSALLSAATSNEEQNK